MFVSQLASEPYSFNTITIIGGPTDVPVQQFIEKHKGSEENASRYSLPYSSALRVKRYSLRYNEFTNWQFTMRLYFTLHSCLYYSVRSFFHDFTSILPISLQQIEYEKIYVVHWNELGESYTLIPTTIFIDKYWVGDILNSWFFEEFLKYLIIFRNKTCWYLQRNSSI